MRFTAQVLLTALLAFALGLYLPWWSIAVAAFAVGAFLGQRPLGSFLSGFLGGFLLWGGMAMLRSQMNDHILARRFAPMVLGVEEPFLLVGLAALLAGIVAGMGALTGCLFRALFSTPTTES
jgi:hypothetical protein